MNKKSGIFLNRDDIEKDNKLKDFSELIVDNSRSMISVINCDYIYEKVNPAFCKAHRSDQKAFQGKSLEDIWGQEAFLNKIKPNIDLCLRGKTVRYEALFKTPGSGRSHFEVVFRPMRSGKGKVTHLIAETFDIGEIKRSEKRAAIMKKRLLKLESDYQNQLIQAQRLETIGLFAGGIAHDFNNIMSTIAGYAEMLRDDLPEDSASIQKTAKILSAVDKAKALTHQILIFSRQFDLEKKHVNVHEVLADTVEFVRSAVPPGIIINTDIPAVNDFVLSDPLQLFRIFHNLMTNAIQSMEHKGGTLSVMLSVPGMNIVRDKIRVDKSTEGYVRIAFRDEGEGIESDLLDRIFEPFFTTREVGKGSGLGLSVVYGLVTDLGGEIFVSSVKKKGTLFEVFLPVSGKDLS